MTIVETIAERERSVLIGALVLVTLLCWAWIVPMARDMYGPMTGASAWMMTPVWDARHVLLLFAMWTVMMVGMMLPSAAPTLLLYAAVMRGSEEGRRAALRVYPMAGGYLTVWVAFSLGAPASFIAAHFARGESGAFRLGLRHGLLCLGCCWTLMLLLFVGGVMNLAVIAALTAFVLLEKLVPAGWIGPWLSAVCLAATAIWLVAR